jgi:hypothetical protein
MRRLTATILVFIFVMYIVTNSSLQRAEAASKYITVSEYIKLLAKELGLGPVEGNQANDYINQLISIGVVKSGDFKDYKADLKRGDMLILLNRADDYLYGTQIDKELVQLVIDKRISDIKKVAASKREDIAKGFIKGFLKGFSEGDYTQHRLLKLTSAIVRTDALNILKMLKNKDLRNKISPDGQLIRTTNLPNNAYMFPYILANFPNRFYEGKLAYEGVRRYYNGEEIPFVGPNNYTYPVDIQKSECGSIFIDSQGRYADFWYNKVYARVWNIFNVDYRTINDKWVESIANTDMTMFRKNLYEDLQEYVYNMKKNKTIVECDRVVLEPSAMYFYDGLYYIRCYVHYRIVSTNIKTRYSDDEMYLKYNKTPYNSVLFSNAGYVDLTDYKLGQWVNGIFDIAIASAENEMAPDTYGVAFTYWSHYLTRPYERN